MRERFRERERERRGFCEKMIKKLIDGRDLKEEKNGGGGESRNRLEAMKATCWFINETCDKYCFIVFYFG